ncbi:alpha-glucosidase [Streptomyces purpurascens]
MPFFDQEGVHEIYRQWRLVLDEYAGERIFVADLDPRPSSAPPTSARSRTIPPAEQAMREVIDRTLDAMRPVGAPATWVLSNHDVTGTPPASPTRPLTAKSG